MLLLKHTSWLRDWKKQQITHFTFDYILEWLAIDPKRYFARQASDNVMQEFQFFYIVFVFVR